MLGLLVSAEVHLTLEGSAAELTREGFEAGVLPAVGDQVRGLRERFPAHRTLVRLLSCNGKKESVRINY